MIGRLPLEIMTGFIQRHRRMTAHEAFNLADRAFVFASVHLREAVRERAICDYINTHVQFCSGLLTALDATEVRSTRQLN